MIVIKNSVINRIMIFNNKLTARDTKTETKRERKRKWKIVKQRERNQNRG